MEITSYKTQRFFSHFEIINGNNVSQEQLLHAKKDAGLPTIKMCVLLINMLLAELPADKF